MLYVSCWPIECIYFSTTTLDSPLKAVKYTEVHKISKRSAPVHTSSTIAKKTLPSYSDSSSSPQNSPTSHANSLSSLRNLSSVNRQLGKSASSSRLPLPVSMAVKKAWSWFILTSDEVMQDLKYCHIPTFVYHYFALFVFFYELFPPWSVDFDL